MNSKSDRPQAKLPPGASPAEPAEDAKVRITIRLDRKVVRWFKYYAESKGNRSYQQLINEVLLDYASRDHDLPALVRAVVQEELEKFHERLRDRLR